MKATVSKENAKLLNRGFKAIIGGNQVEVSLKEFKQNPRKYINSSISYLYENEEELRAYLAANQPKKEAVVLDMAKANRGKAFDKKSKSANQELTEQAAAMIKKQLKKRERLEERFAKNQKAAKAKEAKNKKAAEAKDLENKKAAEAKEVLLAEVEKLYAVELKAGKAYDEAKKATASANDAEKQKAKTAEAKAKAVYDKAVAATKKAKAAADK